MADPAAATTGENVPLINLNNNNNNNTTNNNNNARPRQVYIMYTVFRNIFHVKFFLLECTH